MSNGNGLPKGWMEAPLGKIASEMCLGKMLDKNKNRGALQPYLRNVNVRWFEFDLNDLKEMRFEPGEQTRYELQSDDLVICEGGEPGRAAVWKGQAEDAKIQKALHRVRFHPGTYDPSFAMYYLFFGTTTNRFARHYTGTTIKHLTGKALSRVPFPVPPYNEQCRIVAKIEELFSDLDAGVAALERAKANLKRYRASVLKAAVEGRLTEKWRAENPPSEPASKLLQRILAERRRKWEEQTLAAYAAKGKKPPANWKDKYEEPAGPDVNGLPELPEGWCWTNLSQLSSWAMYGPRFSSDAYADDGVLVLRTTDFSDSGRINLDTPPRMPLTQEQLDKYRVKGGDLLITRTGSLGTLAVFTETVDAIAGAFLIHYRLAAPVVTTWYLFHFLKSPAGQIHLLSGGAGIGRPNLNMPKINSIPIPLPSLTEQQHIVAETDHRLSIIENAEEQLAVSRTRASILRQSILKRAFEGKLVPHDSADEPASKLLDRIQAEHQETKTRNSSKSHRKSSRPSRKATNA